MRKRYCILVTGPPAAGKTTLARHLSEQLEIPFISKDEIKERLFDDIGFGSREEKVGLGAAAMNIMYYFAQQLMKRNQPFILENNFENSSRDGLMLLLEQYGFQAVTVILTGDYKTLYRRFAERNSSPERHRGHVVNDCYPEEVPGRAATPISYEAYVDGIQGRGMDCFFANGPQVVVDTTDFLEINIKEIAGHIEEIVHTLR